MLLATDFVAAIEPPPIEDTPYSETILQSQVPVIKGRMVAVCKVPVYDITAGETDRITAGIGVRMGRSRKTMHHLPERVYLQRRQYRYIPKPRMCRSRTRESSGRPGRESPPRLLSAILNAKWGICGGPTLAVGHGPKP